MTGGSTGLAIGMAMAVGMCLPPTGCFADGAEDGRVIEVRSARFHLGDDPGWAVPGYDDARWTEVELPGSWQAQGVGTTGDTGWYRFEVELPDGWVEPAGGLGICAGVPGNICEVFWNGQRIGGKGNFDYNTDLPRSSSLLVVPIPRSALEAGGNRAGGRHLVAVRVHCYWAEGGLLGKPVSIAPTELLLLRKYEAERWPLFQLAIMLAAAGLIAMAGSVVAAWQWREVMAHAFAVLAVSEFAYQAVRASILIWGGAAVPPHWAIAVSLMQYALSPVALLIVIARILEHPITARLWGFSLGSILVLAGCVLATLDARRQDFALAVAGVWLLAYVSILTQILWRALRRRQPWTGPVTIILAVAVTVGALDSAAFITSAGTFSVAWVDPWSVIVVVTCLLTGWVVAGRLLLQRRLARGLADRVVDAELTERARLARELHDGINQGVLALKLNVEAGAADRRVIADQLDAISDEIREAAHAIHPQNLAGRTVEETFAEAAGTFGNGIVQVEIGNIMGAAIDGRCHHQLMRIFQEMAANAARHGEKGSVKVRWYSEDGFWILETVNRYSPAAPVLPGGIGLRTLRERVEILGGHLVISRRKGEMNMRAIFPEAGLRSEED